MVTNKLQIIITKSPPQKKENEIPVQTFHVPRVIIITNNKNSGESTKETNRDCYRGDSDNYHNRTSKRPKLKTIALQKKPPTRLNYNQNVSRLNFDLNNLNSSCFQGSINKSDLSPEAPEIKIMSAPKKAIVKIIDVDTETPGKYVTKNKIIKRMMTDLKSKSNQNIQIMQYHHFLFEFEPE